MQHRLWQLLTEPVASVVDRETRIKSRWLSTILIVLVPFGVLVASIPPIVEGEPIFRDPHVLAVICLAGLLVFAYVLNRQGHYQQAALLALGMANLIIYIASILDNNPANVRNDAAYLTAIVLFSSLLLSQKYTFGLLILNIIGLVLIPQWAPQVAIQDVLKDPVALLLTIYALVFMGSQLRKTLENHHLDELRREIAVRQNAETLLRASVEEKEVLLKEIHHRVKNNLQIISSLLNLQIYGTEDTATSNLIQDSQNRIRSMALVHERLYSSNDLGHINFARYLADLTQYLLQTYRPDGQGILLNIDVNDIFLNIDTAIPCGLLVNELVSNSFKHGFPNNEDGVISVKMQQVDGNRYQLHVSDNGIGLSNSEDWRNTSSLGLQLVNSLAQQLGGEIDVREGVGTHFVLSF